MTKNAVITGGVRRLGRYISYHLAEKNYNLAILYNSSSKSEIEKTKSFLLKFPIKFKFYKCNLLNFNQIANVTNKINSDFKSIDLLINNAGIINRINFTKITPQLFDKTIAINLKAPLFISQKLYKSLNKSSNPLIINIASLGGLQNWSNYIPYSLSKTALIKLTLLLAKELAPKIRVNAIAPGTIIIKNEEKNTPKKISLNKIPLNRYGNPNDILNSIDFLISSSYITGHIIPVDGGRILIN